MSRYFPRVAILTVLSGLALCGTIDGAERPSKFPDPVFCTVLPSDNLDGVVMAPALPAPIPASINVVTVRTNGNVPIVGASVVATLGSHPLCGSTILTGTTNGSGQVTITFGGGGCSHNIGLAALIKVNGVTIRAYENAKSPDYDGASGNLSVTLADLIQFSNEFLDTYPSQCHDYDNDGNTGLSDLIIFSPTFTTPNSCTP